MKKHIKIYTLPSDLFAKESPVMITEGAILINRYTEQFFISLQIKNVNARDIISAEITLKLFDAKGMPYQDTIKYKYSPIRVKRDGTFGFGNLIPIAESGARSFVVSVSEITFADYSIWDNQEWFEPIGKPMDLETAFGDEEIAKQFKVRYGENCKCMPYVDRDLWYCTCGAVNLNSEDKCHLCARKRIAFQSINSQALSSEAKKRTEREIQEAQAEAQEREKKQARSRKIFKTAIAILPILAVIGLIIATVPPFVERREAYLEAENLLAEKKYEEASAAFAALGDYLNSEEMAEQGVSYEKALFVLECAEKNDSATLKKLGIPVAGDNSEMGIYELARELFNDLSGYKDSASKLSTIQNAFTAYDEQQMLKAYNTAVNLMEEGKYLSARDAFLAIDNYKDSKDMAKESIYERALELLNFCEENNVRGIYINLSNTLDTKTIISMPGAVLTKLGSDAIYQLKMCCYEDGVDFLYEDAPSDDLQPICDAVSNEFANLQDYKDSKELSEKAKACGDFTAEFYILLKDGELKKALNWLDTYDDEIPNRENFPEWINNYLVYGRKWELYKGDSALIPYSAGENNLRLDEFTPKITIKDNKVYMQIEDPDGAYSVILSAELGEKSFSMTQDESSFYYVVINQLGNFTYLRYAQDGTILSSCEYKKAD